MKTAILTDNRTDATNVFDSNIMSQLKSDFGSEEIIYSKEDVYNNKLVETENIFSTWGMPSFSALEIKKYLPNLKNIFYAAGSVQSFAKEFLDVGVRVFSAWQANALPVAEFTFAQIVLASKGFFRASKHFKRHWKARRFSNNCGGNYGLKIGVLGVGSIGSKVCEKLKSIDCQVFYYDPYLDKAKAEELNIISSSLEDIFCTCNVISNHLANKKELNGILNYQLFSQMQDYSTFINTGRGSQISESGLSAAMRRNPTCTALLDVTIREPVSLFSPLRRRGNIIITPHIAGSLGKEVVRMAQYVIDDARKVLEGITPLYEVTSKMLSTMA